MKSVWTLRKPVPRSDAVAVENGDNRVSTLQMPAGLLPSKAVSVRLTLATDIDPTGMSPA